MTRFFFIVLVLLIIAVFPFFSFAAHDEGLVPCGPEHPAPDDVCTTCHAFQLFNQVITFTFIDLFLPATAIAFLIGGVLMLTAGGNETQVSRGRSVLWNSVIGLLIAFSSWVIVNTIINTIAAKQYSAAWYKFPGCESSLPGPSPIDTAK